MGDPPPLPEWFPPAPLGFLGMEGSLAAEGGRDKGGWQAGAGEGGRSEGGGGDATGWLPPLASRGKQPKEDPPLRGALPAFPPVEPPPRLPALLRGDGLPPLLALATGAAGSAALGCGGGPAPR